MLTPKWNRLCASGNEEIDRQHKQLSMLAREASAAFGSGRPGVPPLSFHIAINKLEALLHKHCALEERTLGHTDYPWLAEHRAEHAELLTQVSDLVLRAMRMELDRDRLSQAIARLTSHLGGSDELCRDFLSVEIPWTIDA